MGEGGAIGARRVGALERLVELLRVTQQNQRVGARADGQDVGERHLPRLVHEEHVDRPGHVLA